MAEFTLDRKELTKASRELRKQLPPEVRKNMNRELRDIGRRIAEEAIAAARFKVDPSVLKVRTAGPRVRIIVSRTEPKPHTGKAHAFENAGHPGAFRHPVYGHKDRWTSSEARPFLTPVADASYDGAVRQIGEVVDRAFRSIGFH